MSELSDLALLGIGAVALLIIFLLRVSWGLRRRRPKVRPKDKSRVIVDGSNVMHWGGEPSLNVLKQVISSLKSKGIEPHVIFDANVGYKLGDRYQGDDRMAKMIGLPAKQVYVVESGVDADEKILLVAAEQNLRIVSNDRFRDRKVQYPIVGKKGRILRGSVKGGNVIWQSL